MSPDRTHQFSSPPRLLQAARDGRDARARPFGPNRRRLRAGGAFCPACQRRQRIRRFNVAHSTLHWVRTFSSPPHCPAPEAVVLFDLSKAPFDDFPPLLPLAPRSGFLQAGAHPLHLNGVRPHFHLPAFGVARAVLAHGAVAAVAAVAVHAHAVLVGVAFVF